MRNILISLVIISAMTAAVFGATQAYFSDQETSADNVFTAGSLDLKVDYDCYYNKIADGQTNCPWQDSSWEETDLGPTTKFFDLADLKPGDFGEGTISLHVYNNDAWGAFKIFNLVDLDNDGDGNINMPEPEDAVDGEIDFSDATASGDLGHELELRLWLDQGVTPGFQGTGDAGEGDNIYDPEHEPLIFTGSGEDGEWVIPALDISPTGEEWAFSDLLAQVHLNTPVCQDEEDGTEADGRADGACPGLAVDGHLEGSVTYYIGVEWRLPTDVGNIVQTDQWGADFAFEVSQKRNQANPYVSGSLP